MAIVTKIIIGKDHFTNPVCGFGFVDSICIPREPIDEKHIRMRRINMLYPGTVFETEPLAPEKPQEVLEEQTEPETEASEDASTATETALSEDADDAVQPEGETSDEPKIETDEDEPSAEPPVSDEPVADEVGGEAEPVESVEDQAEAESRHSKIVALVAESNKALLQARVTELGGEFVSKTTKVELAAMIVDAE
jgi:hypothetical protein